MTLRRAVVFPGQGTAGGEVWGEVGEAVAKVTGGEVPYQLSVFAGSVTTYRELEGRGFGADVVAGHSLGEYAAAHVAGSMGLEDVVRLVAERDRLMSEASRETQGGMIAVIGADVRRSWPPPGRWTVRWSLPTSTPRARSSSRARGGRWTRWPGG